MTVADAVRLKEELTKAIDDAEKDKREELTEFESGLFSAFSDGWQQYLGGEEVNVVEWAKEHSPELLSLAKKQLLQTGELLTQEHHEKLMEILREECKKGLPRWKKASGKERFSERMIVLAGDNDLWCTNYAEEGEYYLPFSDLEKLPKEDESHE